MSAPLSATRYVQLEGAVQKFPHRFQCDIRQRMGIEGGGGAGGATGAGRDAGPGIPCRGDETRYDAKCRKLLACSTVCREEQGMIESRPYRRYAEPLGFRAKCRQASGSGLAEGETEPECDPAVLQDGKA